jgi:methylated-DNA-protein-cysteine methyltransferase-like protein
MARRPSQRTATDYARSLARRRAAMDRLNRRLRDVLQERARTAAAIARWKSEHGRAVTDPARENAMLAMMLRDAPAGFDRATLARLLRAILRASRRHAERAASGPAVKATPSSRKPTNTTPQARAADARLARILAVVRRIPRGRVATYGQVARVAGLPRHPRLVGFAMRSLPEGSEIPWHRVVAAGGRIAVPAHDALDGLQRALLEGEGVTFRGGRVVLARHAWRV